MGSEMCIRDRRRAYEEKRASKLGFSSLYAYIEDKILKKKAFEESKVIQNKIEKDNPEKVKEKKGSCSCC